MTIDKKDILPITNVIGLAILDSQRMEYNLGFIMLLVNDDFNFTDRNHDAKIDDFMLNLSKKTLGTLIKQVKDVIAVDDEFASKLQNALDARNYVTHRFFNHQSENLLTKNGRKIALNIVKDKREKIYNCIFYLEPIIETLLHLRGFSAQMIKDDIANRYERD